MRKPVALIILDGWGISESCKNNAVCQAKTPRLDAFASDYPTTWLNASGLDVGLPDGQMGNSEVGLTDSVVFAAFADAPTIEDDQRNRFSHSPCHIF